MTRLITRETPVGELVPTCGGDIPYPAVEIRLKTKDGDEVLIGVIEYDVQEDTLNWLLWPSLSDDDVDPIKFWMTKAEILKQLKERRKERKTK